jgi:hypothetical protein
VRTVVGGDGRVWDVWPVRPTGTDGVGVRPEYAEGWLAFRSGGERLRLAPVPAGWDTLPQAELRRCLDEAHEPEASRLHMLRRRVIPRG